MTAPSAAIRQDRAIAGILFMMSGMFVLTGMDVFAKLLVQADFHPGQILFVRGLFVMAMMLAWLPFGGGVARLKTRRLPLVLLRGIIGILAPLSFFTALKTVPLADATVVFFAAPILMTALSPFVLKERVGPYRWAAVLIGFCGVAIAMNPGGLSFDPVLLLVLVAMAAYSGLFLVGRWMSDTESAFVLVFYFNLGVTIVSAVMSPFVWQPMDTETWGLMGAMAVLALAGHLLLTKAFVSAQIGVISTFEYTALIWAALLGYLVFGDVPPLNVWTGGAVIAASGIFIIYRETRAARARKGEA